MLPLLLACNRPTLPALDLPAGRVEVCGVIPVTSDTGPEAPGLWAQEATVMELDAAWPGGEPEGWECSATPARSVHLQSGTDELWFGWTRTDAAGAEDTPASGIEVGGVFSVQAANSLDSRSFNLWSVDGSTPSLGAGQRGWISNLRLGTRAVGEPGAFEGCPAQQVEVGGVEPGEVGEREGWAFVTEWALQDAATGVDGALVPDCPYPSVAFGDYVLWSL